MTRNNFIEMDLEFASLEIKTDSREILFVHFFDDDRTLVGRVEITPEQYHIKRCMNAQEFSPNLNANASDVWKIGKEMGSDKVLHVVVHCNGKKVSRYTGIFSNL